MYGHDRRFVRVFKNTLFFIYPYFLLCLENTSQALGHLPPSVIGENGDVAPAQRARDDTVTRYGKYILPRRFFRRPKQFLI